MECYYIQLGDKGSDGKYRYRCLYCGHTREHWRPAHQLHRRCPEQLARDIPQPTPTIDETWDVDRAIGAFVASRCRRVTLEEYESRLRVCDVCEHRDGIRCFKCGGLIVLRLRSRVWHCPEEKW